jgi:uncharacterized protein HemX
MEQAENKRQRRKRGPAIALLLLLLIAAVGASAFWFVKYREAVNSNPAKERQKIIQTIGQAVMLPAEEPELSTVTNTAKLTNQTLKTRAKNGDKLLVYAKAKRLIIYRPSNGKVVDMLTIQQQTADVAGQAASPQPMPSP